MNLMLRLQHDAARAAQAAAQAAADAAAAPGEPAPIPSPDSPSAIPCVATTQDGSPCRARPVDGEAFCPFHHPDHAPAVAAGRHHGGVARHRRLRRFPAILDHMHVAELMSELLVEAMSCPEQVELRRLQALTSLSRTLLRAVGVPRRGFLLHPDRAETPAHLPHHLRRYPAPDPELAAFLTAEEPDAAAPASVSQPAAPSPSALGAVPPEALLLAPDSTLLAPHTEAGAPEAPAPAQPGEGLHWDELFDAWRHGRDQIAWEAFGAAFLEPRRSGSVPPSPTGPWPSRAALEQALLQRLLQEAGPRRQAAQQADQQAEEQGEEQVDNKQATGASATAAAAAENGPEPQHPHPGAARCPSLQSPVTGDLPECGIHSAAGPPPRLDTSGLELAQGRAYHYAPLAVGLIEEPERAMTGSPPPTGPTPAETTDSGAGFPPPPEAAPAPWESAAAESPAPPPSVHLPRSTVAINPGTSIHATWPPKLPPFPW